MQWKASFKRKFQGRPSPFVMNIVMCMLMPCPGVSWIIVIVIPSSFSRSFTDSTDGKCRPWHPWHANSHIVIVISYLWLTEMQCWPEKREKIYFFALVTWWLGDLAEIILPTVYIMTWESLPNHYCIGQYWDFSLFLPLSWINIVEDSPEQNND